MELHKPGLVTHGGEANLRIEITDHFVLRRRQIDAPEGGTVPDEGEASEFVENLVLDLALQHPATHQPGVDFQNLVGDLADDDPDEAVIAEAVAEPG